MTESDPIPEWERSLLLESEVIRLRAALADARREGAVEALRGMYELRRGADRLGVESVPAQWIAEAIKRCES